MGNHENAFCRDDPRCSKHYGGIRLKRYENEARERFGNTEAYREHNEKTKNYSKEKWTEVADGLNAIFSEFYVCKSNGYDAFSSKAQLLVLKLQSYITSNFYTCTNEILAGLGKMYVADERFKENIDKNGEGTAEFVCRAIEVFVNERA